MSSVVKLEPRPRKTGIVTTVRGPRVRPTRLDIIEQLIGSMVERGMTPREEIVTVEHGKVQRFKCHDKKKRDGWYVVFIHDTHVAGAFGSWYTREKYNFRYRE